MSVSEIKLAKCKKKYFLQNYFWIKKLYFSFLLRNELFIKILFLQHYFDHNYSWGGKFWTTDGLIKHMKLGKFRIAHNLLTLNGISISIIEYNTQIQNSEKDDQEETLPFPTIGTNKNDNNITSNNLTKTKFFFIIFHYKKLINTRVSNKLIKGAKSLLKPFWFH